MACTEERRQICYSLCSVDKHLGVQVKEGQKYQNVGEVILKKYTSLHPEAKVLRYFTVSAPLPATFQSNCSLSVHFSFFLFFWRLMGMTSFILASAEYLPRPRTIQ